MSTTLKGVECYDWTDVDAGRCAATDLWTPIPTTDPAPEPAPAPEPIHLDEIPAHVLRRDIMKVYRQLGGADYLKKLAQADPAQFNKYLLKVLPQTVEADVTNHIRSIDGMTLEQIRELPTDQLKLHLLRIAKQGAIDVTPEAPEAPESGG